MEAGMTVDIKAKKTATELAVLIMREIRVHPEWDDIIGVEITRPAQQNWDVAFTVHRNAVPPEAVYTIVRQLQAQFDLT
jgi:hypothetical protein